MGVEDRRKTNLSDKGGTKIEIIFRSNGENQPSWSIAPFDKSRRNATRTGRPTARKNYS